MNPTLPCSTMRKIAGITQLIKGLSHSCYFPLSRQTNLREGKPLNSKPDQRLATPSDKKTYLQLKLQDPLS